MVKELSVLVTRPKERASQFGEKLESLGYTVFYQPIVQISEIAGYGSKIDDIINKHSNNSNDFSIITTSQYGIESLAKASKTRDIQLYVIGHQSKQLAIKLGFTRIVTANGDANSLVGVIKEGNKHDNHQFLYVRAEDIFTDIKADIEGLGYNVSEIIAYEANKVSSISSDIANHLKNNNINVVLFFSSRTAMFFEELMESNNITQCLRGITAISMSENINGFLHAEKWRNTIISSDKSSEYIIKELEEIKGLV